MRISPSTRTLLPNSIYVCTATQFFYFNTWYKVREVVQQCYTSRTVIAADALNGQIEVEQTPMSLGRVCEYLERVVGPDDWVDVLLLNGEYLRNIQRA